MTYNATKAHVLNRGNPPDSFLDDLVKYPALWEEAIYVPRADDPGEHDVFDFIKPELGPWTGNAHRRAALVETLRVLAGFESSWLWSEGRDTNNAEEDSPDTISAGPFQISYNSRAFGQDLRDLLDNLGIENGAQFQVAMKTMHGFAIEYAARLLRHTVRHNGPVARKEINDWLRRSAVDEFEALLGSNTPA